MSKGGSTTSQVEVPAWLENAAIENINRARQAQEIGYVPYYGPDVAAFSPMQTQAMQATGSAAQAFGLASPSFDPLAGIPQAQEFAGGLMGYSSAPLYEQSVAELQAQRPAQAAAIEGMFIDPITGEYASSQFMPTIDQIAQTNYAARGDTAAMTQAAMQSPELASYRQAQSTDLQLGDQFVGDDGNVHTVGYDVGQVDPSLANALRDQNQSGLLESLATNALNVGLTKFGFDPIGSGSSGALVTDIETETGVNTTPSLLGTTDIYDTYEPDFTVPSYTPYTTQTFQEPTGFSVTPSGGTVYTGSGDFGDIGSTEYDSSGRVGFGYGL